MNKILVVDDNAEILNVVEMILHNYGFEVDTLSNGHDVVNLTHSFKPDLVLMDVFLGGMDGRDICQTLKESEETKHIPVIMFSAHSNQKEVFEACKAQDFIGKPFEITELVGKIKYQLAHAC